MQGINNLKKGKPVKIHIEAWQNLAIEWHLIGVRQLDEESKWAGFRRDARRRNGRTIQKLMTVAPGKGRGRGGIEQREVVGLKLCQSYPFR